MDVDYILLTEIYINSIIIDDSTSITLFGYLPYSENKLRPWDFVCNYNILSEILIHGEEKGNTLLQILSESISAHMEIPTIVDAENLFGTPLRISNMAFSVYQPFTIDERGEKVRDTSNCFIIDNVQTLREFELNGPKESISDTQTLKEQLADIYTILKTAYKYYLHLLNQDVEPTEAKYCAGLTDNFLFEIARLKHEIRMEQK